MITDEVKDAVDGMADGGMCSWEAGTGILLQNWASFGWGYSTSRFFNEKGGTLQCTDVATKCIIQAAPDGGPQGASTRVLAVRNADGVYLTGLVIMGGSSVSSHRDAKPD